VHIDATAHRAGKLLADRQAQAAAAVTLRGAQAVGLFEALEQPLQLRRFHARAGVAYFQHQPCGVAAAAQRDFTGLG